MLQSPKHPDSKALDTVQHVNVFLAWRNPKLVMVLLLWSHRCWRAIVSLSMLAALFLMQASCFYFPQNMLHVLFLRIPSFFSAKLLSGHLVPSLYCCNGLFYPKCFITLSGFVELHVVSGSPFRQPFSIPPSINPDI